MAQGLAERSSQTSSTSTEPATTRQPRGPQGPAGNAAVNRIANAAALPTLAVDGGAFLTVEQHVRFIGETTDVTLPVGTYVEIAAVGLSAGNAEVRVYSTFGGKMTHLPVSALHAEPRMGHGQADKADTPQDYTYVRHQGPLWNGQPKVEDVAQGYLGDCYLIAAMGAVVASNPRAIMNMFSPQRSGATSYSVTLHRRNKTGHLERHTEVVDPYLPASNTLGAAAYADNGRAPKDPTRALWPALLEKAYAQMLGGYDVAGQGGSPTMAMEAMTGVDGQEQAVPGSDVELLSLLRSMAGKSAMAAGSVSSRHAVSGGFKETSPRHFHVDLKTDQGEAPEIFTNTLRIWRERTPFERMQGAIGHAVHDHVNSSVGEDWGQPSLPDAHDDGHGKLVGDKVSGTVAYGEGKIDVGYDNGVFVPDASLFRAEYDWEGLLDKRLCVYACHAYIFERVDASGLIHLRNPWGIMHPNPMTAADFRRLFTTLNADAVPPSRPGKRGAS